MDRTTRCSHCGKRLVPVIKLNGHTELECISCDDPVNKDKWTKGPLAIPMDDRSAHAARQANK